MNGVTTAMLARACHTFLKLAYPGGPETIPAKRRIYFDLPVDEPVSNFLPPAPVAREICQVLPAQGGGVRGFAFRLGSAHFPNLKLKLQMIDYDNSTVWVFMVDTHDLFSRESHQPPPGHPEASAWKELQNANRELKEQIEVAMEREGLVTFNSLLLGDLAKDLPRVEPANPGKI